MDRQPPPFFKRGPAPLALLGFYVALAIAMMIVDLRFRYLAVLRDAAAVVVSPLQYVAHLPARGWLSLSDYLRAVDDLRAATAELREARLAVAPELMRNEQLATENTRLRALLELQAREPAAGAAVRLLHATRDPFVRRVIIDRGLAAGVVPGQGVIDDAGLVGQVTRVLPLSSEVTLITDKAQATPVELVRTGLRTVAFGIGGGLLELRYLPAAADIGVGDLLVTSGLDGVYLPGLPVARVIEAQREGAYAFARVLAVPLAGVQYFSELILLDPPSPITGRHDDFGKSADEIQAAQLERRVKRRAPGARP